MFLSDVEATHASILAALTAQAGDLVRFGSCGIEGEGLAPGQLAAHLQREQGPVSAVVCEGEDSGVVAEVEGQLRQAGRPFVVVYAGQPDKAAGRPAARSLISTTATKVLCDGKCKVQVRLFEVIILLIILLVALGAGLFMLHILDTPTRFEKEKKDVNRHQE
jgi:hypothetical protein